MNEKINRLENKAQSLEKSVDQRVVQVDDFQERVKEIPMLKQVVMSKDDFETFKEVAKSGIATLEQKSLLEEQLVDLKTSHSFAMQTIQNEKEMAEAERDKAMDEREQLKQKAEQLEITNKELQHENNFLKATLEKLKEFYKDIIKNFSERIGYLKTKANKEIHPNDETIPTRYFADEREIEGYKVYRKEREFEKKKERAFEDEHEL